MLCDSYFDDTRLRMYLEVINVSQPAKITVFDRVYGDKIKEFVDAVTLNKSTVWNGVGFVTLKKGDIDAYKRYVETGSKFQFEQDILGIKFQFKEKDYEKLVKYKDGIIYFFSNIDKVEKIDSVIISVGLMEFLFDRKEVSRFALMDCDLDYLRVLDVVGTVRVNEKEARPESADNGQMKIAVDAVKACQMLAGTNAKKILVVGSSSEGYGGGRTYRLMDTMFSKSEFFLYDPYEVNSDYVTENGNSFHRRAKCFDYASKEIMGYDLVLDDAYVNPENNRYALDPEMNLLKHPAFSCKCFRSDKRFFVGCNVVKQVGKTFSNERRAMSRVIERVVNKDMRFGTCQFCLELTQYVDRDKYDQKFFDVWFKMHPPHYPCSKKDDGKVYGGDVSTEAGDMFVEYEVPPTYCLDYDPIINCQSVNVLDKQLGWYQFSSVERIPMDFRSEGNYCVYVESANCYLTSKKLGTLFPQRESECMKQYMGLFFEPYRGAYVKDDKFHNPDLECVYCDDITLYGKYNFYASVVIHIDSCLFRSLHKIKFK